MGKATALVFIALTLAAGCDSAPVSPTGPLLAAAQVAPTVPVPAPASVAAAVVAIEDAFALGGPDWVCTKTGCQPGTGYLYEVRFLLRETSGASGATIKTVTVRNPSHAQRGTSSQETGEGCWREPIRVAPLGTLDTFHTDAGSQMLSYCYVGIDGDPGTPSLGLDVQFVDDQGTYGAVSTTVTAFRNRTGASQ